MKAGRRSSMSTERVNAAVEALRMGCTREAAAGVAGVTRSTFYRWLEDGTFRDEVEKAEQQAEAAYTYSVQAAVPKSWQAAAWWLERRRHEAYGRREQVDMRIDIKAEVRKLAEELGLDPAAALDEVEAILGGRS